MLDVAHHHLADPFPHQLAERNTPARIGYEFLRWFEFLRWDKSLPPLGSPALRVLALLRAARRTGTTTEPKDCRSGRAATRLGGSARRQPASKGAPRRYAMPAATL